MTEIHPDAHLLPETDQQPLSVMGRLDAIDRSIRANNVPTLEELQEIRVFVATLPEADDKRNYLGDEGFLDKDLVDRVKYNCQPDAWKLSDDEYDYVNTLESVDEPTDLPEAVANSYAVAHSDTAINSEAAIEDFENYLDDYPKDAGKTLKEAFQDYKVFKRQEADLSDAIADAEEAGELDNLPAAGRAEQSVQEVPVAEPEVTKRTHFEGKKARRDVVADALARDSSIANVVKTDRGYVDADDPSKVYSMKEMYDLVRAHERAQEKAGRRAQQTDVEQSAYDNRRNAREIEDAEIVETSSTEQASPDADVSLGQTVADALDADADTYGRHAATQEALDDDADTYGRHAAGASPSSPARGTVIGTARRSTYVAPEVKVADVEDRKSTAKLLSQHVKNVFSSVANSPQYLYAKAVSRRSDGSTRSYEEQRQRRNTIVRGAIGAAVLAKAVAGGYMAFKGMHIGGGVSFADTLTHAGSHAGGSSEVLGQHPAGSDVIGQGAETSADLQAHTEALTVHDNIWSHVAAIAEHHHITDINDPRIRTAVDRIVHFNGLSTRDTTHMAVGQKFEVPDLSDIFGGKPAPAVEHVNGIVNPEVDLGPKHPVVGEIPLYTPHPVDHTVHIPRAEILSTGSVMAAGIGGIAAHHILEGMVQDIHDADEADKTEDGTKPAGTTTVLKKKKAQHTKRPMFRQRPAGRHAAPRRNTSPGR